MDEKLLIVDLCNVINQVVTGLNWYDTMHIKYVLDLILQKFKGHKKLIVLKDDSNCIMRTVRAYHEKFGGFEYFIAKIEIDKSHDDVLVQYLAYTYRNWNVSVLTNDQYRDVLFGRETMIDLAFTVNDGCIVNVQLCPKLAALWLKFVTGYMVTGGNQIIKHKVFQKHCRKTVWRPEFYCYVQEVDVIPQRESMDCTDDEIPWVGR